MDTSTLEALRRSPVGGLVPITVPDEAGEMVEHYAFLPDPLPETVQLSPSTWTTVSLASEALGRLHQACSNLPSPQLLIAPALAREAVDTSWLEGTFGTVEEVLQARLSADRPKSAEVAEIRAYEAAAHQGFDLVRSRDRITLSWLADLQGILAAESRTPVRDAGAVRQHQVAIGSHDATALEARFIPPPADDRLRAGLDQWEAWVAAGVELPPVVRAALAHYQFETLHPFGDGNGRIGRLVIVLQLLRDGAIPEPAITISPWLRKRREEYQDHLKRVSLTGEWDPWVSFFCRAITEQARSTTAAATRIDDWQRALKAQCSERHWSGTIVSLVDDLVEWPAITSRFVVDKYRVSGVTAKGVIDRLTELGALQGSELKIGGAKVYFAEEIMAIVNKL